MSQAIAARYRTFNSYLIFWHLIIFKCFKKQSIYVFLALINLFFGSNLLAQIAPPLSNEGDFVYNGHRVHVSNIQEIKKGKKSLKFKCTLTNTGLQPVFLGKYRKHDTLPLIVIDTADLNTYQLSPYRAQIQAQILQVPVILQIGQTIGGAPIEIKLQETVKQNSSTLPTANETTPILPPIPSQEKMADDAKEEPKSLEVTENQEETNKDKLATFTNQVADTLKPIAQIDSTNILPPSVPPSVTPSLPTPNPEKIAAQTPENPDKKPKKQDKRDKKNEQVAEKPATPLENEQPKIATQATPPQKTVAKDTVVPPPTMIAATEPPPLDSNACPDLTIDAVRIIETTTKFVKLEFIVFNKGNAPANLWGATRKLEDNVSVQFYVNGTPRLTRGSLIIDGIYLQDGLKETKGILAPNKGVKQIAKISTEKITRYNRVIILRIDGFDVIAECDETNNTNSIVPDL